ncbi:MAG TPA: MFS transporter [Patescibacteria group bacterium]|nr:MFS transporter [Patescibacteria group bacterium]
MERTKPNDEKRTFFRRTYFNLSVFQFITFLRRGVFYTFMIPYLHMLMGTVTWTAALGTLNMIGSSLGQNLLWGRICDKYKARTKLIISGEMIAAVTYVLVFLIHRFLRDSGNNFSAGLSIIFGLSILEFFWSMSDVGWAALLTDVTTPQIRGRVIGTLNFIASVGRMTGVLYSGFLYNDGEGFLNGTIFYIVIALLLAGVSLMVFTSRRIKTDKTEEQCTQTTAKQEDSLSNRQNERKYWMFLISLIVVVLGAASISQIFLLFLQLPNGLNFSDPQMTLVVSAWTVGGMIASLGAGRLSDRFGRLKVLLFGLSLAIVTPLFYSFASSVPLMCFVYGLNGVSFWTIQTVGFVFAGDMIPKDKRGRLLGRYNTVMALSWGPAGILIGGPFADLQVERLGLSPFTAYVNAFYASSIIVLIGTVLFAIKIARAKPQ